MKSRVVNLYRQDQNNLGDMLSAPCQYFPDDFPNVIFRDIHNRTYDSAIHPQADVLIVGGGAMLATKVSKKWWAWIVNHHRWLKPEVAICWGVGCDDDIGAWPYRLKFKLVGLRHNIHMPRDNYIYTPDASVMNKEFDYNYNAPSKKDILFIAHPSRDMKELYRVIKARRPTLQIDHKTNHFESLEQFLDTVSQYKLIMSACYHPALWSLWAGKPVITLTDYPTHVDNDRNHTKDPNGSMRCWKLANMTPKCRHIKYRKLWTSLTEIDLDDLDDLKLNEPHSEIAESRKMTIQFKDRVLSIIKMYEAGN